MSTVGKVILGVGAVFLAIVILVVAGVAYWWTRGGGREMGQAIKEGVQKSEKEGRDFGQNIESDRCVDEAISRDRKSSSMTSAISNSIFLQGCLRTAHESAGFCTGVPKPTQIIDSPKWQIDQCRKRGAGNDQFCPQLMKQVQDHCYLKD
jgi:hypothetical protein